MYGIIKISSVYQVKASRQIASNSHITAQLQGLFQNILLIKAFKEYTI